MSNPSQKAIYVLQEINPNEKVPFHEKLGLRSQTPGKNNVCDRESLVFDEHMTDR